MTEFVTELIIDGLKEPANSDRVRQALAARTDVRRLEFDTALERVLVHGAAPASALLQSVAETQLPCKIAGKSAAALPGLQAAVAQFAGAALRGALRCDLAVDWGD